MDVTLEEATKSFLRSKTFWVNVIALIAMGVQTKTGFVVDPEAQAAVWGVVNIVIRFFTDTKVTLK